MANHFARQKTQKTPCLIIATNGVFYCNINIFGLLLKGWGELTVSNRLSFFKRIQLFCQEKNFLLTSNFAKVVKKSDKMTNSP